MAKPKPAAPCPPILADLGERLHAVRKQRDAVLYEMTGDPSVLAAVGALDEAKVRAEEAKAPFLERIKRLEAEEEGLRQQALEAWPVEAGVKTFTGPWGLLQRRDGAAKLVVRQPWAVFDALKDSPKLRVVCTPTFDAKALRGLHDAGVLPEGSVEEERAAPVLAYAPGVPSFGVETTAGVMPPVPPGQYRVPSRSTPGETWTVTVAADGVTRSCDCPKYQKTGACHHASAQLLGLPFKDPSGGES